MKAYFLFFLALIVATNTYANNLDKARQLINQKQYDSAIVINNLVIAKSENDFEIAEAHFSSAYCYKKLNEPVSAVEEYLKSLEYYKDDIYRSSTYNNLGNLFTTAQLYNEAILLFDKAVELETDSLYLAKLFLNRAVSHKKVKQYDKARIDIQNALAIANQLNDINLKFRSANQMGLLAMETQHYDEALLHFSKGNKLDFSKKTYVNLGLTYSLKGQPEEAITQYKKAIDYTDRITTKFRAHQYLGNLYIKSEQFELAKENYLRAKDIYPNLTNPDVEAITLYKSLGNCYGKLGLNGLAIETLNFSFDLMKEYNQVRDVLAIKFTQLAFIKTIDSYEAQSNLSEEKEFNKWKILAIVLVAFIIIGALLKSLRQLKKQYESKHQMVLELKGRITSLFNKIQ